MRNGQSSEQWRSDGRMGFTWRWPCVGCYCWYKGTISIWADIMVVFCSVSSFFNSTECNLLSNVKIYLTLVRYIVVARPLQILRIITPNSLSFRKSYYVTVSILNYLCLNFLIHEQDPCRPGVKDAVKLCSDAGVKVNIMHLN